jgi:DNA repair protein RecN (Recombination protein N)
MLIGLGLRDIVLIDRLDLGVGSGLTALTGETGAGKSILMDALGLALGRRGDAGLVRPGAEFGTASAVFAVPRDHPAREAVREHGLDEGEELVLRRRLGRDGASRAFVNDQPVGVALLRRLGGLLVALHGQHDEQGLLDQATHRGALDAFAGLAPARAEAAAAHGRWQAAEAAAAAAAKAAETRRADEEFLRHAVAELDALQPRPGEEEELASERGRLQNREKLASALIEAANALDENGGIESRLRLALRTIERVAERAGGAFDGVRQALDRALTETAEAQGAMAQAASRLDVEPGRLEKAEERLFALRQLARKHRVAVDGLAALADDFKARLAAIEDGAATIAQRQKDAAAARADYLAQASALRQGRTEAAERLGRAMAAELKPLKLGGARFAVRIVPLAEPEWSAAGTERVVFEVATLPGAALGAIGRIASGGELSRFMLALDVALAGRGDATTLVFDEIDRGLGGATADAVGERLARLARDVQVLAVTHSPQVAARAEHHWRVSKITQGRGEKAATLARVEALDDTGRREEIARMLAGAAVTDAARAAAASLMHGGRR